MSTSDTPPYRYELWKLDTQTFVHGRVTDELLDVRAPEMVSRGVYEGYPLGYEWRVYQADKEVGRWRFKTVSPADSLPADRELAAS